MRDMTQVAGRLGGQGRILTWAGAIALVLAVPLAAMQLTPEVRWGPLDFAVFGAMLAAVALGWEVTARASSDIAYRLATGIALATGFLLTWANLAVGVIGDEGNPLNLIFLGVVVLGAVGALAARFRPRGMARTTIVMAAGQAAGAVAALTESLPAAALTLCFALAWLVSATLYARAARALAG